MVRVMTEDTAARWWPDDLPVEWGPDAFCLSTFGIGPFLAGRDRADSSAQTASLVGNEYQENRGLGRPRGSNGPGLSRNLVAASREFPAEPVFGHVVRR